MRSAFLFLTFGGLIVLSSCLQGQQSSIFQNAQGEDDFEGGSGFFRSGKNGAAPEDKDADNNRDANRDTTNRGLVENLDSSQFPTNIGQANISGKVTRLSMKQPRSEIDPSGEKQLVLRVRRWGPFNNTSDFTNRISDLPKFSCNNSLESLAINDVLPSSIIDVANIPEGANLTVPEALSYDGDSNFNGIEDANENALQENAYYAYLFCVGAADSLNQGEYVFPQKNLQVIFSVNLDQASVGPDNDQVTALQIRNMVGEASTPPTIRLGPYLDPDPRLSPPGCGNASGERYQRRVSVYLPARPAIPSAFDGFDLSSDTERILAAEIRFATDFQGTALRFLDSEEGGKLFVEDGTPSFATRSIDLSTITTMRTAMKSGQGIEFEFKTLPSGQSGNNQVNATPNSVEFSYKRNPLPNGDRIRLVVELVVRSRVSNIENASGLRESRSLEEVLNLQSGSESEEFIREYFFRGFSDSIRGC